MNGISLEDLLMDTEEHFYEKWCLMKKKPAPPPHVAEQNTHEYAEDQETATH